MTNVTNTVNELALFFPCALCGAQPQESCHIQGDKSRPINYPHKMRTQRLWNLYGAGYMARDRLVSA